MKHVLIEMLFLFSLISLGQAAFFEEVVSGSVTNMSENSLYMNNNKITFPTEVITYVKEGDLITYGQPEPLLLVHENDKIRYGYGNIFHLSDKVDFINGASLEILKTKKSIGFRSGMINVKTYLKVSKGEETIEFSLNPGEYTQVLDLTIGVHRAEEPNAPREGPQHWYIYEVRTDISQINKLNYVKPNSPFIYNILIWSLILIIFYFIAKKIKKKKS